MLALFFFFFSSFFFCWAQSVLRGGKVTNYLLEKSRVIKQARGERCFHVMHYLLQGANDREREEYQLLPPG